jgi:nuclear pore complex protein Nup54
MRGRPEEVIRVYGMCWSKKTEACRFNHPFYNLVPPSDVPKYTRPPNVDERSWAQAIQQNPDPQRMVPAFAKGFEDLKKRVEEQDTEVKGHQTILQNVNKLINGINHKHQSGTVIKMETYKRRNMEQASRVVRVMKKIETLRAMGCPSVPEEEAFRDKLQALLREIRQPNMFKSLLTELTSLMQMQDEMQEEVQDFTIDEENMERIFEVLQQQQEGLAQLTTILKQDLQDLGLMLNAAQGL